MTYEEFCSLLVPIDQPERPAADAKARYAAIKSSRHPAGTTTGPERSRKE